MTGEGCLDTPSLILGAVLGIHYAADALQGLQTFAHRPSMTSLGSMHTM